MVLDVGLQVVQRGEPLAALLKTAGEVLAVAAGVAASVSLQLVAGEEAPAAPGEVAGEGLLVVVLEDVEAELGAFDVGLETGLRIRIRIYAMKSNQLKIELLLSNFF